MSSSFKHAGVAASVVSALVAIVSLTVTLNGIWSNLHEDRVHDWQQVVVFEIIASRGTEPISYDEIRALYLDEIGVLQGLDVPNEEISDSALSLVLLKLQEAQLIYRTVSQKYSANLPSQIQDFDRSEVRQRAFNYMLDLVMNESGKHTADDINKKTSMIVPEMQRSDYNAAMNELIGAGYAIVSEDGKVFSITDPAARALLEAKPNDNAAPIPAGL